LGLEEACGDVPLSAATTCLKRVTHEVLDSLVGEGGDRTVVAKARNRAQSIVDDWMADVENLGGGRRKVTFSNMSESMVPASPMSTDTEELTSLGSDNSDAEGPGEKDENDDGPGEKDEESCVDFVDLELLARLENAAKLAAAGDDDLVPNRERANTMPAADIASDEDETPLSGNSADVPQPRRDRAATFDFWKKADDSRLDGWVMAPSSYLKHKDGTLQRTNESSGYNAFR